MLSKAPLAKKCFRANHHQFKHNCLGRINNTRNTCTTTKRDSNPSKTLWRRNSRKRKRNRLPKIFTSIIPQKSVVFVDLLLLGGKRGGNDRQCVIDQAFPCLFIFVGRRFVPDQRSRKMFDHLFFVLTTIKSCAAFLKIIPHLKFNHQQHCFIDVLLLFLFGHRSGKIKISLFFLTSHQKKLSLIYGKQFCVKFIAMN